MTKIYSRYVRPTLPGIEFTTPSRTQRHFAADCDINNIMARFTRTGVLPVREDQPQYGDFSEPFDFRTACDFINDANGRFLALPARIRRMFGNDPAALLDYLADSSNHDDAVALGLIEAPSTSTSLDVTGTTDTKPDLVADQKPGAEVASRTPKNPAAASSVTGDS